MCSVRAALLPQYQELVRSGPLYEQICTWALQHSWPDIRPACRERIIPVEWKNPVNTKLTIRDIRTEDSGMCCAVMLLASYYDDLPIHSLISVDPSHHQVACGFSAASEVVSCWSPGSRTLLWHWISPLISCITLHLRFCVWIFYWY